jgi:O-methyltransferase domain
VPAVCLIPGFVSHMGQIEHDPTQVGIRLQDTGQQRTTTSATLSPDADPFSQIAQNPEQAKVFDEAMATFAPVTAAAIGAAYDFSRFSKLVDVGGGN